MACGCASLIGVDGSYTEVGDAAAASGGSSAGAGGNAGGSAGTGALPGDAPPGSETCDNAADDDSDGKIDCFDPDCDTSTLCEGKCNGFGALPCNVVRFEQNSGAQGATQRLAPPAYGCSRGARSGPEYAYRYDGNAGYTVFVELYGLSADLGVFLADVESSSQCDAVSACAKAADESTGTEPEALTFSPVNGRDYYLIVDGAMAAGYSISVQCSSSSGCAPARAIQAGQSIDTTNAMGSPNVTSNLVSYSCASGNHASPEAAFMFTPTADGDYRVTLANQTTNLDLFVIPAPNCNSTCVTATAGSANPAAQPEAVTFTATADTTYYIVVDGYGTGTFSLAVEAL